ncbi:MAG: RNA-binding protein, partial [Methanobrevibacter sp.]|nr:RNA-binding protein [Methanobrevibacter sp.]
TKTVVSGGSTTVENDEQFLFKVNIRGQDETGQIKAKDMNGEYGDMTFVSNGSDIMSPGIVDASEGVNPGDIILIIDETHGKPLAIGVSLISGEEMVENDSGKAVETKHYVGDDIWNFEI